MFVGDELDDQLMAAQAVGPADNKALRTLDVLRLLPGSTERHTARRAPLCAWSCLDQRITHRLATKVADVGDNVMGQRNTRALSTSARRVAGCASAATGDSDRPLVHFPVGALERQSKKERRT